MGRPNHSISTKVDKELLTRIDAVADERGVSRSAVVRELILEALDADHDPNAAMVAQLQQVQERLERLATQPPTELMAEVQRLHERLDNLEQQSHHQSSQLAAIPLPPPLGQSPTELTVDLSPDELATLLEPDPLAPDFSTPESIASELVTSGAIAPNLSDPESVAPESIAPSSSDPEPTAALAPEADSALLAKTVVETDTPVSALLPEL
ncbi:MAG: ribbon-helix-helix protein, CopG family, partial [Spirulinaceae cyanobacterium]